MDRIKIEEADAPTLRHFAEVMLGLEVKAGTNAKQLAAKIKQAVPDIDTVPTLPEPPAPIVQQAPAADQPAPQVIYIQQGVPASEVIAERPAAVSRPASNALMHHELDPKVKVRVNKTDDKRRPKDVTIGVNGDIFRLQRGQWVQLPYRVYLALRDAVEKAAVPDPEKINPITGEPVMVWEEVHSYPFEVDRTTFPSDEEIAAWEEATGSGFKNVA